MVRILNLGRRRKWLVLLLVLLRETMKEPSTGFVPLARGLCVLRCMILTTSPYFKGAPGCVSVTVLIWKMQDCSKFGTLAVGGMEAGRVAGALVASEEGSSLLCVRALWAVEVWYTVTSVVVRRSTLTYPCTFCTNSDTKSPLHRNLRLSPADRSNMCQG